MNPLTLLPFGSAFTAGPRNGRYRPAEAGLVPDFSAPKGHPVAVQKTVSAVPAPAAPILPNPTAAVPNDAPVPPPPRTSRRPLPGWIQDLVLGLLRRGNRRRSERPVQTEFALQSVTPARNDLTTSDLEVVPARRPGGPQGLSPACRQRILGLWWEQGTRRLRRWGRL